MTNLSKPGDLPSATDPVPSTPPWAEISKQLRKLKRTYRFVLGFLLIGGTLAFWQNSQRIGEIERLARENDAVVEQLQVALVKIELALARIDSVADQTNKDRCAGRAGFRKAVETAVEGAPEPARLRIVSTLPSGTRQCYELGIPDGPIPDGGFPPDSVPPESTP